MQPLDPSCIVWRRPPLGFYKCNVDAGFDQAQRRTRFEICIRDYVGRVVMARCLFVQHELSVHEGEAHGLLLAFAVDA